LNPFYRLLILVSCALEAASDFRKIDSKLWEEDESSRIRYVVMALDARNARAEATRSDMSRAREGALIEQWVEPEPLEVEL